MANASNQPLKRRRLSQSNEEPKNTPTISDAPRRPPPEGEQLFDVLAQISLPSWAYTGAMLGLIFGGCCSNVYALEAIIKDFPASGLLITFTQFALTTLLTLPSHIESTRGPQNLYLSPRQVPIITWILYTLLFLFVNILNNLAFNYDISVPVHIILRSGGSVTTMLVGWTVAGKKYTRPQVSGVLMLTAGVMLAAMSDAHAQGKIQKQSGGSPHDPWSFTMGLTLLLIAQTISAYMGLYIQQIYDALPDTTKPWRENLFYSHALSLPFFAPFYPAMKDQFTALLTSPPLAVYLPDPLPLPPSDLNTLALGLEYMTKTPVSIFLLVLNAITQYVCIRGVNILSARSSALTVTIVLNIRKLASLLLSIWLFGNHLAPGVLLGAVIVFIGGAVYGWGPGTKEENEQGSKRRTSMENGIWAEKKEL